MPLSSSLTRHFDPEAQTQYTSLRPKFLFVEYTATTHRRPFSEIRKLGFQAPEVHWETQQFGVQDATYILAAVIRMTDGKREHIRIYSKEGTEIVPAEIGEYREKEPEQPQWSVAQPGVYMLFYFRRYVPDKNWPVEDVAAVEREERAWETRDELA